MKPATIFALASAPALAAAAVHWRAVRLFDSWPENGPMPPLRERMWVAADNWIIRAWGPAMLIGFAVSIAVVVLLSRALARQRSPALLVADFRAWALVTLALDALGAVLLGQQGAAALVQVFLAIAWVSSIAWVVSCANLVAVLRQLRSDLRFWGAPLAGYALYLVLGSIGPILAPIAAPFIARWRSRAAV